MIGKVRKFIRNSSPDWLNVEVNQDFFNNFSAALDCGLGELDTPPVKVVETIPNPDIAQPPLPKSKIFYPKSVDFPFQGKPHWRRIKQVFETLEEAGTGTYTELINYVREVTGIG